MGRINKTKKFISFFMDLISFGSPLAIIINFLSILMFCFLIPISSLDIFPIKCVFKTYILPFIFEGNCPSSGFFAGCNCPACGMTHAIHYILNGKLGIAWSTNKLAFVVLPSIVILILINLNKILRKKKNKK